MKFTYSLFLPLLLVGLLSTPALGQSTQRQVVASAGGSGMAGNVLIQYTVGEPVVATFASGSTMLTQGFQQPDYPPLVPGADAIKNFIIYPNPAATTAKAQFELLTNAGVMLRIINSAGQMVYQEYQHYGPGQVVIPVAVKRFASGIYSIILYVNGKIFLEKLVIQ